MRPTGGRPGAPIRTANQRVVLRQLLLMGPTSRSEIAEATGLTEAAVSKITRELIERGMIAEGAKAPGSGPGRRHVQLDFGANGPCIVGIGITGYEQRIAVANMRGETQARRLIALSSMRDPARALAKLAAEVRDCLKAAGIAKDRVLGIGVAVAGTVDPREGRVVASPNLGWREVDVAARLGRDLGLPVRVESLMNAMNLAETGSAVYAGVPNILLVNVALGIGASMIAEGRIVRGAHFGAGQIGHVRVEGSDSLCVCGRRGCLDTVSSGRAILTTLGLLTPIDDPELQEHVERNARRLFQTLGRKDADGERTGNVLVAAGEKLGRTVGTIATAIDPDMVLLSGFVAEDERFRRGVEAGLAWYRTRDGERPILVRHAAIKSDEAAVRTGLDCFAYALPHETTPRRHSAGGGERIPALEPA